MRFDYHSYGDTDLGLMTLNLNNGKNLWSDSLIDSSMQWMRVYVNVMLTINSQLSYKARAGGAIKGVLALDEIYVTSGKCKSWLKSYFI